MHRLCTACAQVYGSNGLAAGGAAASLSRADTVTCDEIGDALGGGVSSGEELQASKPVAEALLGVAEPEAVAIGGAQPDIALWAP